MKPVYYADPYSGSLYEPEMNMGHNNSTLIMYLANYDVNNRSDPFIGVTTIWRDKNRFSMAHNEHVVHGR